MDFAVGKTPILSIMAGYEEVSSALSAARKRTLNFITERENSNESA